MRRTPSSKKIIAWTIIVLLAAIIAAYVLFCAFCLLCGWIAGDYRLFSLGIGGYTLPVALASIFGK